MADDAVKMWAEMLSLIRGKVPATEIWRREIPSGMSLPGSWNKPLVCNTAEAFFGFLAFGDVETRPDITQDRSRRRSLAPHSLARSGGPTPRSPAVTMHAPTSLGWRSVSEPDRAAKYGTTTSRISRSRAY